MADVRATIGGPPATESASPADLKFTRARALLDEHVTSKGDGRCVACGSPGPCWRREEAVAIFSRTLRLPADQSQPGASELIPEVVERRVPGGQRQVAGAVLTLSTSGGYSVIHYGKYVGYLHASVGDKFNVYRRKTGGMDDWLGKHRLEDGVKAILRACDRTADEARRGAA